jgi:hypothetical protein
VLFFASLALAADLSRYPACAELTLPPTGPVRIGVPLELRSSADPADGSDLVLTDSQGRHIPAYRLPELAGDDVFEPQVQATSDPTTYRLDVGSLPVEEIRVGLPYGLPPARVTVRQEEKELASDVLVWNLADTAQGHVPITPTTGMLSVEVLPVQGSSLGDGPSFQAVRRRIHVPVEQLELPVQDPVLQEDGWSRYDILLSRALPVDSVEVHAHDPAFSRPAALAARVWASPGQYYDPWGSTGDRSQITRVRMGDLSVETTRVPAPTLASDRLALLVEDRGLPPLEIERVTVTIHGSELVAIDVGAGPHRLCGGAPPGTTPVSDLAVAAAELAVMAEERTLPGPITANPEWRPPELRTELASPGRPFEEESLRWRRELQGSGLVRLALPDELLASLRPDLGDLRVTSQGRLVPHLLRPLPTAPALAGVQMERQERGPDSRLTLHLPHEGLRVQQIVLHTDATVFSRHVEIGRPASGQLEVLRYVEWVGADRPNRLAVSLDQLVEDELVVVVHNGDDPALPIQDIEVQVAGWELLTVIPEEGAWLLHGSPATAPAQYDLELLASDLHLRATTEASLGPAQPTPKRPWSTLDRALLGAGIVVLALGLGALLLDLVRRLPQPSPPSVTPAGTGEVS